MTTSLLVLALLAATPLGGIDLPVSIPVVVEGADIAALKDVAADPDGTVIARSRAVRLLATTAVDDVSTESAAIDALLATVASTSTGELAVQVALARFDRAALRSSSAARAVALATQSSASASLRKAAALMWWRLDDAEARAVLSRGAAEDADSGVRAACRARLRRRPGRSGSAGGSGLGTSTSGVVHEQTHAGSPTSPGQ